MEDKEILSYSHHFNRLYLLLGMENRVEKKTIFDIESRSFRPLFSYGLNNGNIFVSNNKSSGTIKFFSSQKGFGFITPDDGGKEIFVHVTQVQGDPNSLREGQRVSYIPRPGRKGPEATEVELM